MSDLAKGWRIDQWDSYSPLAVTSDGPGDFKSISTDFGPDVENDITFERDVKGFGLVTVSVPVSVLRAYMQAYEKWAIRNVGQ